MTYSGPQHHGEPGRKDATEPERGVAKYSTGADYVGTFLTGKRHGNGKLTCLVPNGKAVYEGAWVHGAATGECVLRYPSGVIYSGRVEDSFPHGFGKLIVPSNVPYGGEYVPGLLPQPVQRSPPVLPRPSKISVSNALLGPAAAATAADAATPHLNMPLLPSPAPAVPPPAVPKVLETQSPASTLASPTHSFQQHDRGPSSQPEAPPPPPKVEPAADSILPAPVQVLPLDFTKFGFPPRIALEAAVKLPKDPKQVNNVPRSRAPISLREYTGMWERGFPAGAGTFETVCGSTFVGWIGGILNGWPTESYGVLRLSYRKSNGRSDVIVDIGYFQQGFLSGYGRRITTTESTKSTEITGKFSEGTFVSCSGRGCCSADVVLTGRDVVLANLA